MTCAKKTVSCTIITEDGKRFTGTNACNNPQPSCPRLEGEGYEKCKTICQQESHAEIAALKAAEGIDLRGATAYLSGLDWFCRDCQRALQERKVFKLVFVHGN